MKISKKLALSLMVLTSTFTIVPHGGGGFGAGFAGGLAGGMIGGAMVNAANQPRDPEYYEYKERRDNKKEINKHRKAIRRLEKNTKLTAQERQTRINEHKEAIKDLQDQLA